VLRFVGQRVLQGLAVLFGVLLVVFTIFSFSDSDPSRMLGGQRSDAETLSRIRKELLLDQSVPYRFAVYLNDLSPVSIHSEKDGFGWKKDFNGVAIPLSESKSIGLKLPYLGKSFQTGQTVNQIIAQTFPETAVLAVVSILVALFGGVALAIWKAAKPEALFPRLSSFLSVGGMAFPSFFMAMLVAFLGAYFWFEAIPFFWPALLLVVPFWFVRKWGRVDGVILSLLLGLVLGGFFGNSWTVWDFPGTGLAFFGSLIEIDPFHGDYLALQNLWLPCITLAIRPLSVFFQLAESSLLEERKKPYFNTALSKGLTRTQALIQHALPNALSPIITTAMGWLASLLAGAVFIEFIFGWKGLGLEIFEALEREDQPVIVGLVLFFSALFVVVNILVDISYTILDPRVKASLYERKNSSRKLENE